MGGQAAPHPADLQVVYLCQGNHMVKTFAMLVFRSGFFAPSVSLSLGKLTVDPAPDLKSNAESCFPI